LRNSPADCAQSQSSPRSYRPNRRRTA
jgi:hypothetical protein